MNNGSAELDVIDPEALGLDTIVPDMTWDTEQQLGTAEAVLQGHGHMAFYNQTLLNAAVRLHLAGRVNSVEEGVYTCKDLLDKGEAWKVYCTWRDAMLPTEIFNHYEEPSSLVAQDICIQHNRQV